MLLSRVFAHCKFFVMAPDGAVLDYGEPYQSPNASLDDPLDEYETSLSDDGNVMVSQQAPIHLAIVNHHEAVVEAFIQHKGKSALLPLLFSFILTLQQKKRVNESNLATEKRLLETLPSIKVCTTFRLDANNSAVVQISAIVVVERRG